MSNGSVYPKNITGPNLRLRYDALRNFLEDYHLSVYMILLLNLTLQLLGDHILAVITNRKHAFELQKTFNSLSEGRKTT